MKGDPTPSRRIGRPLSFDRDAVLDRAMTAFWRSGYETTSVAEPTSAMRISAPSLYGAFGDKRGLFLAALERYVGRAGALQAALDDAPTAREAAARMLRGAAERFTGADTPPGCLVASAAATGSEAAASVRGAVAAVRADTAARPRERIERDMTAGTLPTDADASSLAALVMVVIQGMSALARDGAGRAALLDLSDAALAGWPSGPGR